jgi:hypothetical protein
MRTKLAIAVLAAIVTLPVGVKAEDITTRIKKAVQRSTLDQQGTKPFHLVAELAPSFDRDKGSGRSGEVEIWWVAPTQWRREVRSPEFHQIEIVNNGTVWQKNDGEFFPEWLRETAVALVKPVPDLDRLLPSAKAGEVKDAFGSTHISWVEMGSDGAVSKGIGAGIDLGPDGMLFATGLGYDAGLAGFSDFHGRSVARKVTSGGGGVEVTARVTVLEDLKNPPPQFFEPGSNASDPPIETRVVDELAVRKNLIPQEAAAWPELAQGPLQGVLMATVVIDRGGRVRDVGNILSDNPGLSEAARERIANMRFKAYMVDGLPVQVVTTITLPFSTERPAGTESFETAKTYFDRARQLGFPAAGAAAPYILRAEFTMRDSSGALETGKYTDTWASKTQWRREVTVGDSRIVRSQDGDNYYLLEEGPSVPVLRLVLIELEPIPSTEVWVESDWRIKRDTSTGLRPFEWRGAMSQMECLTLKQRRTGLMRRET